MALLTDSVSTENSATMKPSTMTPPSPLSGPPRMDDLLSALPRLTMSVKPTTPPTFTVFRKLPSEMRNRIWHLAAFEPRIIKLVPYNLAVRQQVKGQFQHPPMLHTSREARREGLRYYQKCVQKCCDIRTHSQNIPCNQPRNIIYANYEADYFRLGRYDRYVPNDNKLAFDWKVVPLGGFNLRIRDILPIKRLQIELYSSQYPNATATFRNLKPLRDNLKLEECTFLLNRWIIPHRLKATSDEDSLGTAIYHNRALEAIEQVFKKQQQRKVLTFAVMFKFASKADCYDLPPCAPVFPITSKAASKATSESVEDGDGMKGDIGTGKGRGDEHERGDATGR